jgi:hypothetical protein
VKNIKLKITIPITDDNDRNITEIKEKNKKRNNIIALKEALKAVISNSYLDLEGVKISEL